jgi:hypothetical protein
LPTRYTPISAAGIMRRIPPDNAGAKGWIAGEPFRHPRRWLGRPLSRQPEDFMSIFGNIMSAIFGRAKANAPEGHAPSTTTASGSDSATSGSAGSLPRTGSPSSVPQAGAQVDVEAILKHAAAEKKEKLNWKTSIVDLMKVLDLDSGLAARKELAVELGYTGDTGDSATMNIWLHKQVMVKLAQNGGKVPEELKA